MSVRAALLLVDFINTMEFDGAGQLAPRAVEAARHARALKRRAIAESIPVVYVNDNFGDWGANFDAVARKAERSALGRPLVEMLPPQPSDLSILKPRHSGFYGTPLEFLLDELQVNHLILTGLQTHICVLFTAHDAYLRRYGLWVPDDCVASEHMRQHTTALMHLAEVAAADVQPGSQTNRPLADVCASAARQTGRAGSEGRQASGPQG